MLATSKFVTQQYANSCDTADMTANDKIETAAGQSTGPAEPGTGALPATLTASEHGTAILKQLGPSLAKRGVPETSYVMVNLANGEFVTGKTKAETMQRFASLHPGAEGWMQLVGEVIGVSLAADANTEEPEVGGDSASSDAAAVRQSPAPRWNGRRGPSRG